MPCDYSLYPAHWFSFYRPYCLRRAGERRDPRGHVLQEARCEQCGALNRHAGIVLTIAHLDHDATNPMPSLNRLRAWCQRCHNAYDAPHRARTRAAGILKTSRQLMFQMSPLWQKQTR